MRNICFTYDDHPKRRCTHTSTAVIPDPYIRRYLTFKLYTTGMSDEELLTLQNYKIQAMDLIDTLERLNNGIKFVEHNIGMIAARLTIQNI